MMNDDHRCFCELAPLYALDLLDLEERLWIETQVLECPDLAEELASYQTAVGLMPYSAPAVPMAADLKDRLFDRLGLALIESVPETPPETPPEVSPGPKMFAIKSTEMQWKPGRIDGVEIVLLSVDEPNRMCTLLVKLVPGIIYPIHQHQGIEEIYMLEGELVINQEVYLAGDYIRSYPNSIHSPSTEKGCTILIRTCIDDNYNKDLVSQLM